MELSWSTFVLEIINFLVLIWILKRFLYKPVLEVIARRRAGIEKTLADAEALNAEAKALQAQYEGRLAEWSEERQRAQDNLNRELENERRDRLLEMQATLEKEREKARVIESRRQADATRRIEDTALVQSARFAARLIEQGAGPETEARLIDLAVSEFSGLPVEHVTKLRNSYGQSQEAIVIASAFEIPADQQKQLQRALEEVIGKSVATRFEQDSDLIAGLRITIGPWVLGANLHDELKGFAELAHGE